MIPADVSRLTARLASVPPVFLSPTDPNKKGTVHVAPVVADLARDRGTRPLTEEETAALRFPHRLGGDERNDARRHLDLVLRTTWLLHDPAFQGIDTRQLVNLLQTRLKTLSKVLVPRVVVEDPDRREELVRICLWQLGIPPLGESQADAMDRLATLDTARRQSLLAKARAALAKRAKRKAELEKVRREKEEAKRQAARTTFED